MKTNTELKALETRYYPAACTSAYCGKVECPATCPRLPALRDFKAWRERTGARQIDPIWSPSAWRSSALEAPERR